MKKITLLIITALISMQWGWSQNGIENFITVKGNKLMDGDREFRFVSFNVPTLNYNEDEFAFTEKQPYSLPDEYEIRDIFETVRQLGGRVIRMYTIPVQLENESPDTPTYVKGPGEFVEESFQTMDLVLKLANEYNIRIIFSTLNNFRWMGGAPQYAGFRGKTVKEFYTDKQLIKDYKKTLKHVINRVNTLTGVAYKDDKAILCWETGNELESTPEWTAMIAKYIKKMDKNHLIMDGFFAFDDVPVRKSAVEDPNIDIINSHHYELDAKDFSKHVKKNIEIVDGKKPYIIGEYGFVSTTAMEKCINDVIESDVVGILIWGLRGHRSEGGFYWHSEPLGYGRYKSYHWPGFDSGTEYDEKNLFAMMRKKASEISGLEAPQLAAPATPELLPIDHTSAITWKGSTGATGYDVYRAEGEDELFVQVGFNVSDAANQYVPHFEDNTVQLGKSYYYKIKAINKHGASGFSNTVGPVLAETFALIDNMNNFGKVFFSSESVTLESSNDRIFKEDMYRFKGNSGDEMIYYVPGNLKKVKIYSFSQGTEGNLTLSIAADNNAYQNQSVSPTNYNNGKGDYGYWIPILYDVEVVNEASYLKIKFSKETQISRVELFYQ
ncbi:hypothetical protein [Flagellimonas pacifica]|uniref:mannan endo-1,4-beta-mannosidase n=1 Tax=Flagellimonas pacifica TaxID=1247520 RepID=A0A285MQY3_9FLAO|nr:hypothetical protein [Allomuricauda parva]SNY99575.1 hypothetical protein SAMN06265377_1386 [Allomuricauda parva]